MDYQVRQELDRKADTWKVEELQRTVDNLRRENSDLQETNRRNQNSIQLLHEALRQTISILTESMNIDDLHPILNQL